VELATTFSELATVGDLPVLKLAYPTLARKVYNAREFRAKVPESLNFVVSIELDENVSELETTPVNISIKGMAFSVSKEEQKMFTLGETHTLKLYVNDELQAVLNGTVRHLSKVRKKGGIEHVCGVEFDLATRTIAAVVESLVASVQRAHLKELAEKSDASGIDLIA
jgi:c-di-GMP-binding flagellar brake protein YcgR